MNPADRTPLERLEALEATLLEEAAHRDTDDGPFWRLLDDTAIALADARKARENGGES